MKIKPSLPKGTRDFLPQEVARRNYIFDTIRAVFRQYGFEQIDTPAFERLETLTGKYGEEGDRLLFKILNSGDYLKEVNPEQLAARESKAITKQISEKGLRYDLTVPLARYVVQHQEELVFPFRRYHIGPVWRADRPQKGRYQEFYQCDADVIGSTSLLNEVELTQIFARVFQRLSIEVEIRINNRKILEALALYAGCHTRLETLTTIIDKLDKIGIAGIERELGTHGFHLDQTEKIIGLLNVKSLKALKPIFENIDVGKKGIEELEKVMNLSALETLIFDITLARGLNYYTGVIWEIKCRDTAMGSIGSGGRYDNLTGLFGGREMSGVGISFGIERIYDVMVELGLFPATIHQSAQVLFVHFDEASEAYAFNVLQAIRASQISAEIYTGRKKLDKQLQYANDKKIPTVVVVGADEMQSGMLTVKEMSTGQQNKLTLEQLIASMQGSHL